jgi:hypothetical protein
MRPKNMATSRRKNLQVQTIWEYVTSHIAWKWGCVYICINAPSLTQRILKLWWPWTYQNSVVKSASARVVQDGWPSGKSGSGEPKADNIVSLRVNRYKWYQSHFPVWDGGNVHKSMRVASGHSFRPQEWEGSHEGRQWGRWVPRGGDCDVPHRLGMWMCLYV